MNLSKLLFISALLVSIQCNADSVTNGNNSPIISNTKGNVVINYQSLGMSIEAHESILRKEIEIVENELRKLGDEKTKKLVDKLSSLRKKLDKVIVEKTRLSKMVYEYRKKFSELNASRLSLHANKSDKEIEKTDLYRVEESEKERVIVVSEIKITKDEKRMMRLLNILMGIRIIVETVNPTV